MKRLRSAQPDGVEATRADTEALRRDAGFEPRTPLAEGLTRRAAWYRACQGT